MHVQLRDISYLLIKIISFINDAEIAQLVEQRTENPRVPSSSLGLGTIFINFSNYIPNY